MKTFVVNDYKVLVVGAGEVGKKQGGDKKQVK
jgi:hypothetical protein